MEGIQFTTAENRTLTEVYRRLNVFHEGRVTDHLILLALPNQCKTLIQKGILKPASKELPRVNNWYNLTIKGQKFFESRTATIDTEENQKLFSGQKVINFNN